MPERLIFGRILLDIFLSLKTEWQNKKKKREKIPQSGKNLILPKDCNRLSPSGAG